MKDIYKLGLNEYIRLIDGTKIMRVPGYWIYVFSNGTSEKVPYNLEFKNNVDIKITKEIVTELIANRLGLPKDFYCNGKRSPMITRGKQILSKILYERFPMNHYAIADMMKYRTHVSSSNLLRTADFTLQYNQEMINAYNDIIKEIE